MNEEKLLKNEELSAYCTFRIGGPADYFYRAKHTGEIPDLIKFAKSKAIPYFIIGVASNVLFDTKGFRGLIIKNETENIEINNDEITADSGVMLSKLIKTSLEHNLNGLEKWLGLPGTVGGAVRGNAGCNGLETKDIFQKATIYFPSKGELKEVDASFMEFGYRESKLKKCDGIVLNATFKLQKNALSKDEQEAISSQIREFRLHKQPFGASSGSFFKNPSPEKPAGLLIDQAGLKGKIIGKAQISEKHGNFFLNLGGATSKDMLELAMLAKREVKAKFGIELEGEVQVIAENGRQSL